MAATVLLTTEGTYPYFTGGVSVWCDQLIRRLANTRYHIFAIVPSPKHPLRFELPGNIASCRPFPLWGTSLPGLQTGRVASTVKRAVETTEEVIEDRFLPHFRSMLRAFLVQGSPVEPLAAALVGLQIYFETYDYAATMQSRIAWSTFLAACRSWLPAGRRPNLEEATACMRWLIRYLGILAVPHPSVDLVHASMTGLAGLPGVISKLRHGTPYLVTEHGIYLRELYLALSRTDYPVNSRRFLLSLNEAIVRTNYRYADTITSLGDFNRDWQIRLGAEASKTMFVPNGVDTERFGLAPERRPARLTVLTLARCFSLKGIDVLLEAIHLVRQRVPGVLFRILGERADPEYYNQCLSIVEKHQLHSNIEWGETDDPAGALNEAHVFCLPSISEGMPYSVLEAMFSGCPVVATDVGNVASVLAGTGLLVRPKDPAGLSDALLKLLDGPEAVGLRSRLAEAALRRAHQHFTADACAQSFDDIYSRLSLCEQISQPV
ncbi:MAG: GT4 family glycosyltransferase PelF [Acidobacteria bacterium]|nr:GT4 family glycosyltransferase PelF [Acidobacteriota bacterium]